MFPQPYIKTSAFSCSCLVYWGTHLYNFSWRATYTCMWLHVTCLNNSKNMFKTNAWKNEKKHVVLGHFGSNLFSIQLFFLQSPPKLSLVKVDHLRKLFWCPGNFAPRIRCWATKQTKKALFSKPSLGVSIWFSRSVSSKPSFFAGF